MTPSPPSGDDLMPDWIANAQIDKICSMALDEEDGKACEAYLRRALATIQAINATRTPSPAVLGSTPAIADSAAERAEALAALERLRSRCRSHAKISNSPEDMQDWIDRDAAKVLACLTASAPKEPEGPTQEELRLGKLIDRAVKAYYDDGDADFMCNILEGKFASPQYEGEK